ncbi:aspartate dehydrogenase [Agrobacterium tumefaciens]|uniref:aspartate dehydrogenase n=1 Tax=Agrobacterium tumefaciens TaxID=358 RepID=UPI00287C750F|nr:aspartate dehydrogenase [Agrobacterium tumefaciens]MDS7593964.1 aspartate dehydrogenase [Agrobacterium tumefaciens]
MSKKESVCLVGWGALGRRVSALLAERVSPARIEAVAVRDVSKYRSDLPPGAQLISSPEEIAQTKADLVVEVAERDSVLAYGRAALLSGMDFAVSSTSALVDPPVLQELTRLAVEKGCSLLIPPGALGGIDALSASARLGLSSVTHRIIKPSVAWLGTRAETLCDLKTLRSPFTFFDGSAREAADHFPKNANVAVITSLAGVGLEKTRIHLVADPSATCNMHEIFAEGEFGQLRVQLQNRPLLANPKTSEITALNIVRMIENRSPGLVI